LVLDYEPLFAAADGSGTATNIVSVDGTTDSILYYDFDNTDIESTDETSAVTADETFANGTDYTLVVRWEDAGDYFEVSKKESGSWTHGGDGALDADGFDESGTLYLHYGNEYPAHYKNLYIYDFYLSDSQVEGEVWEGINRGIFGFF